MTNPTRCSSCHCRQSDSANPDVNPWGDSDVRQCHCECHEHTGCSYCGRLNCWGCDSESCETEPLHYSSFYKQLFRNAMKGSAVAFQCVRLGHYSGTISQAAKAWYEQREHAREMAARYMAELAEERELA